MKSAELQKKTVEELHKILGDERRRLQRLRFDLAGGKVKNIGDIRETRRSVARILTVLKQK